MHIQFYFEEEIYFDFEYKLRAVKSTKIEINKQQPNNKSAENLQSNSENNTEMQY